MFQLLPQNFAPEGEFVGQKYVKRASNLKGEGGGGYTQF